MRVFVLSLCLSTVLFLASCGAPKPPEWTLGRSTLYPDQAFLVGVGMGTTQGQAEDRARAEIAKIFTVDIHSRESTSESEWLNRSGNVAGSEYRQAVEAELTATSDKILSGVQIAEIWKDEKTGAYHALAVLDRLRISTGLRSELDEADQAAMEQVRQAEIAPSKFRSLGHYLQTLKALELRRSIAADLRITDPSGWVSDAPYSAAVIGAKADAVAGSIQVGIDLQNDRDGIVRGAVIQALTSQGIQLAPSLGGDVRIQGRIDLEQYKTSDPWQWTVASAQVEFLEPNDNVLDSLRVSVREGSRIQSRSETMALEKLGDKLAKSLLERLTSPGQSGK